MDERSAPACTTDLLRSVLTASPLPTVVFDERGTVRVWNAAAERVFGWAAEEVIGRPYPLVPPEEREETARILERALQGQAIEQRTVRRCRKDGTCLDVRVFTAAVLGADGTPAGIMGIFEDITEQVKTERALRLAMVVVENSPVVVVRWRSAAGWPVEYISENVRQFGYTPEDFGHGLLYDDLVLREDLARVARECEEALAANTEAFTQEYRILTKDGRVRWIEDRTRVSVGPAGQASWEGILVDVTERRHAEDERRRLERRVRDVLDDIRLLAVMLDREGRVTFCNRYAEGVTGWTREDLAGRDWFETCVPERGRARARAIFEQSIVRGASEGRAVETPIVTRKGDVRDISWDHNVLLDAAGHAVGAASFGRDVTDQRQLEAQYRHAQKMEAIGQLAGGVAHDFNNLLQVITGYTALALSELTPEQPLYPEITEIRRATERATALVRKLLMFSRRQKIDRRPIDINETIADLLKMLRRLIGEHIELEFNPGTALRRALADPGLLEQVLMNLCLNARDVMPGGGRIHIATSNTSVGRDFVQQRGWGREGRYVLLTVSDTGPGIPPALRDRIFEPFFTTKEVGKGTGLGLATVYGIVKQHDGMIEVAGEVPEGATFRIYLPIAPSAEQAEHHPQAVPAAPGGHETILLAEDEELVRSLARRVLEKAGYRVLVARDGQEATALIESCAHEIDLALLDVVMPKGGGREVGARLRALRPDVPVLYCSGYGRQSLDESWLSEVDAELLLKPYEPKALLRRVHERLARPSPRA